MSWTDVKIYSRDVYIAPFTNENGLIHKRKICAPCNYGCLNKQKDVDEEGVSRCTTQFIDEHAVIKGICECWTIHAVLHNMPGVIR